MNNNEIRNHNTIPIAVIKDIPKQFETLYEEKKISEAKQVIAKNTSFESFEFKWNKQNLEKLIKSYPFVPSKLTGKRCKENVSDTKLIVLDFDKGDPTIEEFKENYKDFPFSYCLYTTISHGREVNGKKQDRFRVLIPLSENIDEKMQEEVKMLFGEFEKTVDKSGFTRSQYFIHSPESEIYFYDPKEKVVFATIKGLKEYILNSPRFPKDDKSVELIINNNINKGTKVGEETFSLETNINLHSGEIVKVKDIKSKTSIFCPFCTHDEVHRTNYTNANAFIDFNISGKAYIYCSSHAKTFWLQKDEFIVDRIAVVFSQTNGKFVNIKHKGGVDGSKYYIFKNTEDLRSYCEQNRLEFNDRHSWLRVDMVFDPSMKPGLHKNVFNIFEESELLKNTHIAENKIRENEVISLLKQNTPIIYELMKNLLGEDKIIIHKINWLSNILCTRKKVYTAWVITSKKQGIGKDLFFNKVIAPIFGENQSQLLNGNRLNKGFNALDSQCWIRGYNELFSAGDAKQNAEKKEFLKDMITSKNNVLELKGVDAVSIPNCINYILFSNNEVPICIDEEDRRFNVIRNPNAIKVKEMKFYKNNDHLENQIAEELPKFTEILLNFDYSETMANDVIATEAKSKMIEQSLSHYEEFCFNLKNKNSEYFEIDEIFSQLYSSTLIKEDIVEYLNKGFIPASIMKNFVTYFFPKDNYGFVLNQMKKNGLIQKAVRDKNSGKTLKVWCY